LQGDNNITFPSPFPLALPSPLPSPPPPWEGRREGEERGPFLLLLH